MLRTSMTSMALSGQKTTHPLLRAGLILLAAAWALPAPAQSNTPIQGTWVTDGPVFAIAQTSDTIYLGGDFSTVGPYTGGGVVLNTDASYTNPQTSVPSTVAKVNGTVYACVPTPWGGGWIIGGAFTRIGDVRRSGLAHIKQDGTLDAAWGADVSGTVYALAYDSTISTSTLYIGGDFSRVDGENRGNIAALNIKTGAVTSWNPGADSPVRALALRGQISAGNQPFHSICVGGDFSRIGGQARNHLAELGSADPGNATSWAPNLDGPVRALTIKSKTAPISTMNKIGQKIYVGGAFTKVGDATRRCAAAFDLATGALTPWDPNPGADAAHGDAAVNAIAIGDIFYIGMQPVDTLYIGGQFQTAGGKPRNALAAVDGNTGTATNWDPALAGSLHAPCTSVQALQLSGDYLKIAGNFTQVRGTVRKNVAKLETYQANVSPWAPTTNDTVYAMASGDYSDYLGGRFTTVNSQSRDRFAVLDAASGTLQSWPSDLSVNGPIYALAIKGSTLYIGGQFNRVNGQDVFSNLVALNLRERYVNYWVPNPNGPVYALAATSSTVYAGGKFTHIGTKDRNHIAALDVQLGYATPWDPNASQSVNTNPTSMITALAVDGQTVYAGGYFTHIGGQDRNYLAALDNSSGLATNWNPQIRNLDLVSGAVLDGSVNALTLAGGMVVFGGSFTNVGPQRRLNLAAVDPMTGAPANWDPSSNGTVTALASVGSRVFAGGHFGLMGGQKRSGLAEMDLANSTLKPWAPQPDPLVNALSVLDSSLCVGGDFTSIGGDCRNYFAQFNLASGFKILTDPVAKTVNPGATVTFSVTTSGTVPVSYQWMKGSVELKDGGRILGATSSTLTIAGAQQSDEGAYACLVTNGSDGQPSTSATLSVNDPPAITAQPASAAVNPGATVSFSVEAQGTGPVSCQWKKGAAGLQNGGRISGATSPTLTIKAVQYGDDGLYTCVVSNDAGSTASQAAKLALNPSLAIVSAYGSPSPAVGSAYSTSGTQVTANVAATTINDAAGTTRRVLTGWKAVGAAPASGSGASLTFTLDKPTTITWQWKTQYKLTVTPVPAAGGAVTLGDGTTAASGWYDAGAALSLKPKPASSYFRFVAWWGAVHNASSPLSLKMDQPCTLTASFRDIRNGVENWTPYK